MVGISAAHSFGIDIEYMDPRRDTAVWIARFLAPAERDYFAGLAPSARAAGFWRFWTLKEAYYKATQCAGDIGLSHIEVAHDQSDRYTVGVRGHTMETPACLAGVSLKPARDCVAAVVGSSSGLTVRYFRWDNWNVYR